MDFSQWNEDLGDAYGGGVDLGGGVDVGRAAAIDRLMYDQPDALDLLVADQGHEQVAVPADEYNEEEDFMFTVWDPIEWTCPPDAVRIASAAAGADIIYAATGSGSVFRIDINDIDHVIEYTIPKKSLEKGGIHKVFVDRKGDNVLVALTSGQVYLIAADKESKKLAKVKPRLLSKTSKYEKQIDSVAWGLPFDPDAETTDKYCPPGEVLLGTHDGVILLAEVEQKGDVECDIVFELKESDPITGIEVSFYPKQQQQEEYAGSDSDDSLGLRQLFVMVATPYTSYQFLGATSFDDLFDVCQSPNLTDVRGEVSTSELHFYRPQGQPASMYSWITALGIVHGGFDYSVTRPGDAVAVGTICDYPGRGPLSESKTPEVPISMALTEYHFLLVYPHRLLAVNRVSKEVVFDQPFDDVELRGLITDVQQDKMCYWLYDDSQLYEVEVVDEDRGMWAIYKQNGKYEEALELCQSANQRAEVFAAQAEQLYRDKKYEEAAVAFGKSSFPLERVCLKFVAVKHDGALRKFLLERLNNVPPTALIAQGLLASWITELFLAELNELFNSPDFVEPVASVPAHERDISTPIDEMASEESFLERVKSVGGPEVVSGKGSVTSDASVRYFILQQQFYDFLGVDGYGDVLHKRTTYQLISSYGRMDDLLYYAEMQGDYAFVVNYHIQNKAILQAIKVLNSHFDTRVIAKLYYDVSPTLITAAPAATVDLLIAKARDLDPSRLLPALMRYDAAFHAGPIVARHTRHRSSAVSNVTDKEDADDVHHGIRFLEAIISGPRGSKDPAIHNYLVSLYARRTDGEQLRKYVESKRSRDKQNMPVYDYKYALRQCHREGHEVVCITIYVIMKLFPQAVELALKFNIDAAIAIVETYSKSLSTLLQKRLWLAIFRHIIHKLGDIPLAIATLKSHADSTAVHIEDILPYFPDTVKIGVFGDEICDLVASYDENLRFLAHRKDENASSVERIRHDVEKTSKRHGKIKLRKKCAICRVPVLGLSPAHVFACSHVFHVTCAASQVVRYLKRYPQALWDAKHPYFQVLSEMQGHDDDASPLPPVLTAPSSLERERDLSTSRTLPAIHETEEKGNGPNHSPERSVLRNGLSSALKSPSRGPRPPQGPAPMFAASPRGPVQGKLGPRPPPGLPSSSSSSSSGRQSPPSLLQRLSSLKDVLSESGLGDSRNGVRRGDAAPPPPPTPAPPSAHVTVYEQKFRRLPRSAHASGLSTPLLTPAASRRDPQSALGLEVAELKALLLQQSHPEVASAMSVAVVQGMAGAECCMCGRVMIDSVTTDLVDEEEYRHEPLAPFRLSDLAL